MPQIPFRGKPESERFLEPAEFQKLIQSASGDSFALVCFLVMGIGGLRTIEVASLKVRSLDRLKKGLWVKTAKRKDESVRFVPLDDGSFQILERMAGKKKPDDLLIDRDGLPVTRRRIRHAFTQYKERAGIRKTLGPHSLRHLAGIIRSEEGASPQEVAQFLGHKTLDQVLVYCNLRRERNEHITKTIAGRLLEGMSLS